MAEPQGAVVACWLAAIITSGGLVPSRSSTVDFWVGVSVPQRSARVPGCSPPG